MCTYLLRSHVYVFSGTLRNKSTWTDWNARRCRSLLCYNEYQHIGISTLVPPSKVVARRRNLSLAPFWAAADETPAKAMIHRTLALSRSTSRRGGCVEVWCAPSTSPSQSPEIGGLSFVPDLRRTAAVQKYVQFDDESMALRLK